MSRQRYWGAPIPIVYDPEGNAHPIPEKAFAVAPADGRRIQTDRQIAAHVFKEFIERTENIFVKAGVRNSIPWIRSSVRRSTI